MKNKFCGVCFFFGNICKGFQTPIFKMEAYGRGVSFKETKVS